jgi:DNA-binding transcriptional LysR family regulator
MRQPKLDWTLLRSFLAVAELGSLSAAARALELTQPTIGRHLDALEAALRITLFARSARGLSPTDAALDLVPHAKAMAATAAALERTASGEAADERGTVRLTASEVIGAEVLPAMIARFRELHPAIAIELVLSNLNEDLLRREADIAVRMVRPTQQQLVARKIGDVPALLYAHRRYAKRRGVPKTLDELSGHDIIGYDVQTTVLNMLNASGVSATREAFAVRTDNDLAQLALLRAGVGIGGMQKQLAARERDLVPVLHGAIRLPLEIWVVMHEDLRTSRRVRLLFDFLAAELTGYVKGRPMRRRSAA